MWKIGHIYIVPESEMRVIEWWLTLLDRLLQLQPLLTEAVTPSRTNGTA